MLPNALRAVDYSSFNSLVHRLLHAADVIPLGRQHLFYCLQDLRAARDVVVHKGRSAHLVVVTRASRKELTWWIHQLDRADQTGLPLASRYSFPGASSESHLVRYSDAARELDQPIERSGGGAWAVIRGVFYYVIWTWAQWEIERFSINVLEAKARDIGGIAFLDKAKELGCVITHTSAYVDNTTAEHIAERGRTSTAMLNALNIARLTDLRARGVHETNERVTSVDNDVADALSRDAELEALRFPRDCGLSCVRIPVTEVHRAWPALDEGEGC